MVTGNLGYIGSTMVPVLTGAGYEVTGYDIGYYEDCYLTEGKQALKRQIKKDVRDVVPEDLAGIDCVIHLAGLSNDPLGELNVSLTEDINYRATIRFAECAKKAGVKRFLYASSQSVYGVSDTSKDVDEDGTINPITAYAKTKWQSECDLKPLCSDNFVITCLRPATAYGASPNLRTDIVFNAFVAYAFTNKLIEIKSDGTPWRPMTHIRDITAGFIACIEAPAELVSNQDLTSVRITTTIRCASLPRPRSNVSPVRSLPLPANTRTPAVTGFRRRKCSVPSRIIINPSGT
jgi:nucleoside-diphosphate-sugar epimerase